VTDIPVGPGGVPSFFVKVGGEHLRVTEGRMSSSMGDRSYASFTLDLRYLAAIDLTSPVQLVIPGASADPSADDALPRFTGHVVTASPDEGTLAIKAEGALGMVESKVGLLQTAGVTAQETIYLVARQGGFPAERLKIQGLDEMPLEVFVVEMPVVGITVDRVVSGPGVEFLPLAEGGDGLEFGPFTHVLDDVATRWGRPTARARTYVTGRLMYDAEQEGIARIERALDALLATATYGLSRDPWERDLPFDRAQLRARPAPIPVVFAQGVASGRRWLHALAGNPIETHLDVGASFERWSQVLSGRPSDELVRALRALRDAADEARDVFDRCHAFCTVLEYYAASSKPRHVVSKSVKKQALAAIKSIEMADLERDRLRQIIGQVNSPPLIARVRHQVVQDGTPVSDVEWTLILKLRGARNDAVHGKGRTTEVPDADELRWGVSIASRLLLYRWVVETGATPTPTPTPTPTATGGS